MLTRLREKASSTAEEDERSAVFMELEEKLCFSTFAFARRDSSYEFCEALDHTGRRHIFPFSKHSFRPVEVNKEIVLHGCVFQAVIFNSVCRSELFIMCRPQSCREGSSPTLPHQFSSKFSGNFTRISINHKRKY